MLPFHQRSPATTVRCFWKPRSSHRHIPSQLWNMVHHLMNEVSVQQFHDVICAKFMNKKQKLFWFSIFATKKNETAKSKLMQETRWRWLKTEIRSPRPERQRWCGQGFVCGFTFKVKISLSYVWKMKYDCEKHFCLIPQVGIIVDPSPAQTPSNHTSRAHSAQGVSTWHKHTHTGTDTHIQIHTHRHAHANTQTHIHTHLHRVNYTPHTQNSGCTTTRAGCLDMARSPSSNTSNYFDTSDQSMQKYCETQTIYTYVLQLRRWSYPSVLEKLSTCTTFSILRGIMALHLCVCLNPVLSQPRQKSLNMWARSDNVIGLGITVD